MICCGDEFGFEYVLVDVDLYGLFCDEFEDVFRSVVCGVEYCYIGV